MGTSTGGLLAVALGLLKLDMDACDHIYKAGCCCRVGNEDQPGRYGYVSQPNHSWCGLLCAPRNQTASTHQVPSPRCPPSHQVLGRKVFSRVVATKDSKEESWMEVCGGRGM